VNIVPAKTQKALAARVLRHDDDPVAYSYSSWLRDRHNFTCGFMPENSSYLTARVLFVLGAHWCRMHLDQDKVILDLWLRNFNELGSLFADNSDRFHFFPPP
jgi:hypothetical protein